MKSMYELTIQELREAGYAVVIFTPSELEGADPQKVEDSLVETAWDIIKIHADKS
jgi:hypothetical protein